MLTRYTMHRGARPADDPLPDGVRQDTRKHTRHCLRPTPEQVTRTLGDLSDAAWERFEREYEALLEARFADDPTGFEELAELARTRDVFLGCSCPTRKNPDVRRCHTALALRFFAERFPDLTVAR